jgi:predicted GIY-YIG superfamily endonuclease
MKKSKNNKKKINSSTYVKWTHSTCLNVARQCKNKTEFRESYPSAYTISAKKKWLKDIYLELNWKEKFLPKNYWTKDMCHKEALRYSSRLQFQKESASAYKFARKKQWLNEICSHMQRRGNLFNRYIYIFEFSDKSVYIGLTYDTKVRYWQHLSNKKIIIEKRKNYEEKFIVLPTLYPAQEAAKKEIETIEMYRNQGWTILNKYAGGGLGRSAWIWTEEKILEEVKKYKTRNEFLLKSAGAYYAAKRMGIRDKIWEILPRVTTYGVKWTSETILEEAKKHDSYRQFTKTIPGAYHAARAYKICNKIKELFKKPKKVWTKDEVFKEIKKYRYFYEIEKRSIYKIADKLGLIPEIINLFPKRKVWTKEQIFIEALKYPTYTAFNKTTCSARNAMHRLNLTNETKTLFKNEEIQKLLSIIQKRIICLNEK